jgi:hypothetical protein
MVGLDATTLSLILHPSARPLNDPTTGKPVERVEDRIEKLLEDLDADNERIILPTPALCEFLVLGQGRSNLSRKDTRIQDDVSEAI